MTALLSLLPLGTSGLPFVASGASDPVRVVGETDLGTFELEVDVDRAGMDVVRAIHRAPNEGQRLAPPVGIVRVYRSP